MKVTLFIAFALLTGWISTSSLDTQKRLKKIEAQQSATLKQMDDNLVKLANLINDANFEAQQVKVIAENNNAHLRKLTPIIGNIDAAIEDSLFQMQRIEKNIQVIEHKAPASTVTPPIRRASSAEAPTFTPPRVDTSTSLNQRMRDQDASNAARALEGIRDELMWKNAKDAIK